MLKLSGKLARLILANFKWEETVNPVAYRNKSKLEALLGPDIWTALEGKTVIDFGCGTGEQALEIAQRCHSVRVKGLDIQEDRIEIARNGARHLSLSDKCEFSTSLPGSTADIIISLDAFEHFKHPDHVLNQMASLLRPDGRVMLSFGPPWFHPKGSHFPGLLWANVLFTESSLMEWRSHFKTDGAKRFEDVSGGLNQMSVAKFKELIHDSPFYFESLRLVPIRKTQWLHCRTTQEFLTATVRATLRLKPLTVS